LVVGKTVGFLNGMSSCCQDSNPCPAIIFGQLQFFAIGDQMQESD
jgi:hypothetical protein